MNIGKTKERVIVYVDGFNLYFGMREAGLKKYKWLNIYELVRDLLKPNQELVAVKYFTSRVANNPEKQKRQNAYLEALAHFQVEIIYGHYQTSKQECNRCQHKWLTHNEKMTDVNIAGNVVKNSW